MPSRIAFAYDVDYPEDKSHTKTCTYREVAECPSCHYGIQPNVLNSYYVEIDEPSRKAFDFYLLCLCPRCRQIFLSKYKAGLAYRNLKSIDFDLPEFSVPLTPRADSFSDAIRSLSPRFAETYAQANIAESHQLYQICGTGYRKSLEYLVKDYLCHKYPDDTEKIRSEFLGASIKRIEDSRVKVLAERSTWIGNDETHYVRKHDSLDFSDMKRFIKAILNYVESELAFEEATSITSK